MDMHDLIDQYYDGSISETDARQLEGLLQSNVEVRKLFVAEGKKIQKLHDALGRSKSISERLADAAAENSPSLHGAGAVGAVQDCPRGNVIPFFDSVAKYIAAAAAVIVIAVFLHTDSKPQLSGTAIQTPNYQEEILSGVIQIAASVSDEGGVNSPLVTVRSIGSAVPFRTEPAENALTIFLDKESLLAKNGGDEEWEQFVRRLDTSFEKIGLDVVVAEQGADRALTILWTNGKARFAIE